MSVEGELSRSSEVLIVFENTNSYFTFFKQLLKKQSLFLFGFCLFAVNQMQQHGEQKPGDYLRVTDHCCVEIEYYQAFY